MRDEPATLAIDATTELCGVVIARGRRVIARSEVATRAAHSELLVRLVRDALAYVAVKGKDLARVVVSRGPGSFTGIRVGLATGRALALGWQRPVRTVTAFDCVYALIGSGSAAVLLDARRGQLYAGAFAADGRALGAHVLDPQGLEDWARGLCDVAVVAGSALSSHGERIARAFPHATRRPDLLPGALGAGLADAGGRSVEELSPFYLRPPDARLPERRP